MLDHGFTHDFFVGQRVMWTVSDEHSEPGRIVAIRWPRHVPKYDVKLDSGTDVSWVDASDLRVEGARGRS